MFIIFLFFLFLSRLKILKSNLFLLHYFLFLFISSLISVLNKHASFLQSVLGAIDISRKFMIYLLLSSFTYNINTFRKIYSFIEKLLLLLGIWTIVEFVIIILFPNFREVFVFDGELNREVYRFGFPKLGSVWGFANIGAPLYLLLFFIYQNVDNKNVTIKKLICIMQFFIFQSRMVILSFLFYLLINPKGLLKKIRVINYLILTLLIILFSVIFITEFKNFQLNSRDTRVISIIYGINIWKDNKIFGLGPGTFGGNVSFMFSSEVYNNLPEKARTLFFSIHTTDVYWIQILVEIGFLGLLIYVFINYKIGKIFRYKSYDYLLNGFHNEYSIMKGIGDYVIYAIPILGMGINLNYFTAWTLAIILGSVGLKTKLRNYE
ncbi:MAG: O-antigen ligase family protein [candidate division WOR-3 bacterium]